MQTSYYINIQEKSPIKQNFNKTMDATITRGQKKTWGDFLKWIRLKSIEIKWDFKVEWY